MLLVEVFLLRSGTVERDGCLFGIGEASLKGDLDCEAALLPEFDVRIVSVYESSAPSS